jgi:hypothetical protein
MPKKRPRQMELFPGRGEVHALGLLGWEDALWTKPLEIELLCGDRLVINLITIRRLRSAEIPSQFFSLLSPSRAPGAGK